MYFCGTVPFRLIGIAYLGFSNQKFSLSVIDFFFLLLLLKGMQSPETMNSLEETMRPKIDEGLGKG